jgi:glycosyltransferase involved in cell wall biosynthesis
MTSTSGSSQASAGATIGVVIASHNYGRFLAAAIRSVLNQTRPPEEVVVVDDGSTDDTAQVLSGFGDAIKTITQTNQGVNQAKAVGFAATTSELVLFLDADDFLFESAIEEILRHCRPGLAKIQFNLEKCDVEGRLLGTMMCEFPADYTADCVRHEFAFTGTYTWPVSSGNAYVRRLVLESVPVEQPAVFDGVLNTVAPLYGDVVTIDKPLGAARYHGASISRSKGYARQIQARRKEFDILKQHAVRLNAVLPDIDFLDAELKFVSCRMVAKRLGLVERSKGPRSVFGLWHVGVALSLHSPLGWCRRLLHALWFTGVLVLPKALVRLLVFARSNRINALSRWRRMRRAVLHRSKPASDSSPNAMRCV